jgi:hypothetical protein
MSEAAMGAKVQYCGHKGFFVADIFKVAGANVIRHGGPVTPENIQRPTDEATHTMVDFPEHGFWRPDLGVFVVPESQVKEIR